MAKKDIEQRTVTQEECDEKLAEYKAATADRVAKGEQEVADKAAMETAIAKHQTSYNAYIAALQHEHAVEDEYEDMIVEQEPPPLPESGTTKTKPEGRG